MENNNKNNREDITNINIGIATQELLNKLKYRLEQKGYHSFASTHEILGIITEEYHELVDAQKSNNISEIRHELLDVAVACLFGVACIEQNSIDW